MTKKQKDVEKIKKQFSDPDALIRGINEWSHPCKKCKW